MRLVRAGGSFMKRAKKEAESLPGGPSMEDLDSHLRLDIYIVNSGWDSMQSRILMRSLDLIKAYIKRHNLYILSPEQSVRMLSGHPDLIGKDPLIIVVDKLAKTLQSPHGYGAQVALGLCDDENRVEWLIRMFLRVVNTHSETLDIAYTFQEFNHKEGIKGAIDIIADSLEAFGQH